jgi:hypothetical protein
MGGSPLCGLGVGLKTPHRKKSNVLRNVLKHLGHGLILCNDLLVQYTVRWPAFVSTVMNLRVP